MNFSIQIALSYVHLVYSSADISTLGCGSDLLYSCLSVFLLLAYFRALHRV